MDKDETDKDDWLFHMRPSEPKLWKSSSSWQRKTSTKKRQRKPHTQNTMFNARRLAFSSRLFKEAAKGGGGRRRVSLLMIEDGMDQLPDRYMENFPEDIMQPVQPRKISLQLSKGILYHIRNDRVCVRLFHHLIIYITIFYKYNKFLYIFLNDVHRIMTLESVCSASCFAD